MIETIKIDYDAPHMISKVILIGEETYKIDATNDYLMYAIQKASEVFNVTFYSDKFQKVFITDYFVNGVQHNEALTAWAKVLLVEFLEAQVRLGVMEMQEALRIIKLEYPGLVWSQEDQKKILHRKEMMEGLWNGYGLW